MPSLFTQSLLGFPLFGYPHLVTPFYFPFLISFPCFPVSVPPTWLPLFISPFVLVSHAFPLPNLLIGATYVPSLLGGIYWGPCLGLEHYGIIEQGQGLGTPPNTPCTA